MTDLKNLVSWHGIKKPRPVGPAGVDGEHKAHAIWLRKGEINRLTVRWKQVIASMFTGVGYPVGRPMNRTTAD